MWYAVAIIAILVLIKPDILSTGFSFLSSKPISISPASSVPSIYPVSVVSSSEKLPQEGSNNFLENPALRMMAKTIGTQAYNLVTKGTMELPIDKPIDLTSAMTMMFSGDIQTGGQIGSMVGTGAAMVIGTAAFPLAFTGMVLGQMIGGAFEESTPFSKAQQVIIGQHIDIGPARLQKLHDLGFTDQQIINWIGDHPEENYWYLMSLLSTYRSWSASKADLMGFWEPSDRLILNGVYTIEEKAWLDNFAHDLGFDIELGVDAGFPYYYQRSWGEVEGSFGGWHNEKLDLNDTYQKYLVQQALINSVQMSQGTTGA
jgi:hypothetical protein